MTISLFICWWYDYIHEGKMILILQKRNTGTMVGIFRNSIANIIIYNIKKVYLGEKVFLTFVTFFSDFENQCYQNLCTSTPLLISNPLHPQTIVEFQMAK